MLNFELSCGCISSWARSLSLCSQWKALNGWNQLVVHVTISWAMPARKAGKQRSIVIWLVFDCRLDVATFCYPTSLLTVLTLAHFPRAYRKVSVNDRTVPDTRIWNEAVREMCGVSLCIVTYFFCSFTCKFRLNGQLDVILNILQRS